MYFYQTPKYPFTNASILLSNLLFSGAENETIKKWSQREYRLFVKLIHNYAMWK